MLCSPLYLLVSTQNALNVLQRSMTCWWKTVWGPWTAGWHTDCRS